MNTGRQVRVLEPEYFYSSGICLPVQGEEQHSSDCILRAATLVEDHGDVRVSFRLERKEGLGSTRLNNFPKRITWSIKDSMH